MATNQQEVMLKSKLHAAGLMIDIETFDNVYMWDEHCTAKTKASQRNYTITKGDLEVHGNAFEHEFLRDDTQV